MAVSLGFGVAKPWGDSERYDFILDSGTRLWRVQVKSTSQVNCGAYSVNAKRHMNGKSIAYKTGEIDFLIAQIVPEDWRVAHLYMISIPNRRNVVGVAAPAGHQELLAEILDWE